MFNRIITIVLLLVSTTALSDEMYLNINIHAHHWNREAASKLNLNEVNPGVGLEFVEGDYRKMIGFYRNSDRNTSAYALLAWAPVKIGVVKLGAFGGMVTGYESPYLPVAGATAIVEITEKVNLNITAIPTISSIRCYGFLGFQLGVKL